MLDLTPAQAAGLLLLLRAQLAGRHVKPCDLPLDIGPVLVDLACLAAGAAPTVHPEVAVDAVATNLAFGLLPPTWDGPARLASWRERQAAD